MYVNTTYFVFSAAFPPPSPVLSVSLPVSPTIAHWVSDAFSLFTQTTSEKMHTKKYRPLEHFSCTFFCFFQFFRFCSSIPCCSSGVRPGHGHRSFCRFQFFPELITRSTIYCLFHIFVAAIARDWSRTRHPVAIVALLVGQWTTDTDTRENAIVLILRWCTWRVVPKTELFK